MEVLFLNLFQPGAYKEILCIFVFGHPIKFITENDKPIGAIILGNSKVVKIASKVFERKASIEELKRYF